jgi:hypothetical protein
MVLSVPGAILVYPVTQNVADQRHAQVTEHIEKTSNSDCRCFI